MPAKVAAAALGNSVTVLPGSRSSNRMPPDDGGSTVASIMDGLNFTINLPALLTQPQTTLCAYGAHMVPMGECGPGGFGMMILTDGAVPMALARDSAVEIQAWIAEG